MNKIINLLIVLVLIQIAQIANASSWDNFLELKNKYYYIDKQSFNEITCNVEVPLIANTVKQLESQLSSLQDKIDVIDDLSKFTMTYNMDKGLTFNRPEFDIHLKTNEGIADPARVKNGIEISKNGFNQTVDGVINTIEGIFDDYIYPQENKYKNLIVSRDHEKVSVSYEKEGSEVHETFSGNTVDGIQEDRGGKTTYNLIYGKNASGKFLLKKIKATITQPSGSMRLESSISYQDIGQLNYPKQIKTSFQQEFQSIKQKGEFEINLTNCTKY